MNLRSPFHWRRRPSLGLGVLGLIWLIGCGDEGTTPASTSSVDAASDVGSAVFGDAFAQTDNGPKPDVPKPLDVDQSDGGKVDSTVSGDVGDVAAGATDASGDTGGGKPDSTDAGSGDASGDIGSDVAPGPACLISSDCDDSNPCTTDGCKSGKCVYVGNGLCCQSGADCDDGNACTADSCSSAGCLHTPKACNDGLGCTSDSCNPADGQCKHSVVAGYCAIDGQCVPSGTAGPGACFACVPELESKSWSVIVGKPCDDQSACTKGDQCDAVGACLGAPAESCCKADADCNTSNTCTTGTCDTTSGKCAFAAKPDCCAAGSCCDQLTASIRPDGAACGSVVVATEMACNGSAIQARSATAGCDGLSASGCSSDSNQLVWSAWQTVSTCGASTKCVQQPGSPPQCVPLVQTPCSADSACSDGNACTDDLCVSGTCANLVRLCPGGDTCQTQACDAKTGSCSLAVLPSSCRIDNTCLLAGVKHPTDPCKVCDPSQSASAWSTAPSCKCTTPGPCCQNGEVAAAGTVCGVDVVGTEYRCDPTGIISQKRQSSPGCSGAGGVCGNEFAVWGPWKNIDACPEGSACVVSDPATPPTCSSGGDPVCSQPDPFEVGVSIGTAANLGVIGDAASPKYIDPAVILGGGGDIDVIRYTVLDQVNNLRPTVQFTWQASVGPVEICAYVACSGAADGQSCAPVVCPSGSTAISESDVSGAQPNGCCVSGKGGELHFTPTAMVSDKSMTVWLRIENQTTGCQKVQFFSTWGEDLAGDCVPGTTCCASDGSFAAAGTACGSEVLASSYQCSSSEPGGSVQRRDAVAGCTGASTTCSTAAANYAWGSWTTFKPCGAGETCKVSSSSVPGTCEASGSCTPGSTCCNSDGTWAAAGTWCGKKALEVAYQCSGNDVQVRKRFATCAGGGNSCSPTPGAYSEWQTVSSCAAGTDCTPGATPSTMPSCAATTDACQLVDAWEAGTDTNSSVLFGNFDDGDSAQYVQPVIRLGTGLDKDYLVHTIDDKNSIDFSDPRVYVEWSASEPVLVCAAYRCWDGAGGEDCYDIECNEGADTYFNSAVSTSSINGCCKEAKAGVIDFVPDAPLSLDESGEVFWNVKSVAPVCQEVQIKLAFGDESATDCAPGSTCCTPEGKVAAAGTACGATVATQYACVNGDVASRTGQGTCSSTAKCQTAAGKLTFSGFSVSEACLDGETCMVGAAATPGQCQVAAPAGSCAGACGGAGKQGTCYCDALCVTVGDCCADYSSACGGTCSGACGGKASLGNCWCDADCTSFGDCCLDKASVCK